jgi:hypothetical protein
MLSTSTTFSLLFQLVSATVKDGHGTGERATSNIALKKGNVKQSSRMTTNTSKSIRQSKVKNDSSDDEDGKMDAHTARWIEEAAWKKLFLPSLYPSANLGAPSADCSRLQQTTVEPVEPCSACSACSACREGILTVQCFCSLL